MTAIIVGGAVLLLIVSNFVLANQVRQVVNMRLPWMRNDRKWEKQQKKEYKKLQKENAQLREKLLELYDMNDDGIIDTEEMQQYQKNNGD